MANRFDAAKAIADWLATNPPAVEIVDRLERAEHEAFLWHCVEISLTPELRARFEQTAASLLAAGYRKPTK